MPIEIICGLYLGNRVDACDVNFLSSRNINTIINVSTDIPFLKNLSENNIECIRIAVSDNFPESENEKSNREFYYQLLQFCKLIDYKLSNGMNLLVHCKNGKYSSTCLVIAYVMYKTKMGLEEIYAILRTKYPLVKLKKHIFREALKMFEKDIGI